MASKRLHRSRIITIVLSLVAWLPSVGSSQQDSGADEQRRVVAERIQRALAQGGPYSKDLIEPLTSLVEFYQDDGRHDLATAATEQALQVIRANYGLRSLDQAPLIQERIRSEEERGNHTAAWDLEQALLTLARANPRDMRAAAIFHEVGDKRMDLLRRYDAGEFPPQFVLGCYYTEAGSITQECIAGNRRTAIRRILEDAQRNYFAAIAVTFENMLFTSTELRNLELNLIRSAYSYGSRALCQGPCGGANYQMGRESLHRLIAYDVANDSPLADRADALLQIADWDLLHNHRPLALDMYAETYQFLKREGVDPSALDAAFSPEIPVVLPAFQPNPLVTIPNDAYIDVSFEITRYGNSERVRVMAKTANVSDEAETRLVNFIKRRMFRPRVVDGELARSATVVVRHYVHN